MTPRATRGCLTTSALPGLVAAMTPPMSPGTQLEIDCYLIF